MWYHWDKFGEDKENHFADELDPLNTGVETLRGIYYNPTAPRMTIDKEQIELEGKVGQDNPDEFLDIKGYNLTQPISVSVEGLFEVSTDEKTWGKTVTIGTEGGRLYVRYVPDIIGNHTGTLTIESPEVKRVRTIMITASSCNDIKIAEALPNGEVGEKYSASLNPTGSEGPYQFKIVEGKLPEGLSMSTDGIVSGTIEKDGNYRLLVSVTDKYGCVSTGYTNLYVRCMVVGRFPYDEGFESTFDADCWKQSKQKGNADWTVGSGVDEEYEDVATAHSGKYNAVFSDKAYNENTTLLVSPQFDFTGYETAKLSFYRLMPAWDTDQDELKVYYRTSAYDEWHELATYNEDTPEWTLTEIELPDVTDEYFIAFGATGNYGHGIGIDDVNIDYGTPTSIQALNGSEAEGLCYEHHGDVLTLSWKGEVTGITVFDTAERLVARKTSTKDDTSCRLSTKGWTGNTYVVVATMPTGSIKKKVLINK